MPGGGIGVGYQMLGTSSFDRPEIELALQLLDLRRHHFGDGVVALDCGANIGAHTVVWATHMHGWGEVLAIEAQERIFYALAGNLTLNNCFNARALWAAVGEREGFIQVPVPDYQKPGSYGSLELIQRENTEHIGQDIDYAEEACLRTRLLCIDGLGLKRFDFLKIDIEGMEMQALQGAAAALERFKPQLLVERLKSDESLISEFLQARGYRLLPMGINLLAVHTSDPASQLLDQAHARTVGEVETKE